jgi:Zn-dependent peptidase ImmA (M78 family)
LRDAGISEQAIDAAWPAWWREELGDSTSGRAELRFALARKLGMSPKSLIGERVEFIWDDSAKFKHLSADDADDRAALTAFGLSLGRMLIAATREVTSLVGLDAAIIRDQLLSSGEPNINLQSLLTLCWSVGIPVIHLRVFPLEAKRMHAMVVAVDGRYAILLGKDASYPAPVAFTLAHELGHIVCRHLDGASALVDVEDPAHAKDRDDQETEADQFALELLTGRPDPKFTTSEDSYNAPTLAAAVLKAAPEYRVEPGTLALCLAFRTGAWPQAMTAMKFIYGEAEPVWHKVNMLARTQLSLEHLAPESADYVLNVLDARD